MFKLILADKSDYNDKHCINATITYGDGKVEKQCFTYWQYLDIRYGNTYDGVKIKAYGDGNGKVFDRRCSAVDIYIPIYMDAMVVDMESPVHLIGTMKHIIGIEFDFPNSIDEVAKRDKEYKKQQEG